MQRNTRATAQKPDLKLWDLNGRLNEHTEELEAVESRMQALFTQQEGNAKAGSSSSEYWKQISNRVGIAEGSGPKRVEKEPHERE